MQMLHVSAPLVRLPAAGADAKADAVVRSGAVRRISTVIAADGAESRVGCEKGTTYRHPSTITAPGAKRRERRAALGRNWNAL